MYKYTHIYKYIDCRKVNCDNSHFDGIKVLIKYD